MYPHFYQTFGLITHDTNVCIISSSLNVRFGNRHVKFGEWLRSNLGLSTPKHVKSVIFTLGHANKELV